jgi:TRAP-type C4-dicarboxylate transport system permease small subunit
VRSSEGAAPEAPALAPSEGVAAETVVPHAPLGAPGRVLALVAGLMIGLMMVLTTIDVIGRYFLNAPLFGAFEATEILMGLVIFAGMPLATAAREHITVNFLESVLSRRGRCLQAAITDVICAIIAAVMAWRIEVRGTALVDAHETTLELGITRGWIAWAMAALLLLTAATFLYAAVIAARGARADTR